jgi:hypothetical protein
LVSLHFILCDPLLQYIVSLFYFDNSCGVVGGTRNTLSKSTHLHITELHQKHIHGNKFR